MRLLGRLQEGFRVRLGMAAVFAAPTLAEQAELLVRKEKVPGEAETISRALLGLFGQKAKAPSVHC
jgi:hypothetical protein